jgi:alkanesulfonate monooxygenase SsuD/methylene tetrahydromethanopterin reductase-like flavin-dependent oxidoreductase (luciferase family)
MDVYSVTPETVPEGEPFRDDLRARLTETAHAGELAGHQGILVPHNLREVDPWMIAGFLGAVTRTLIPLIAVQPAAVPPHTAAAAAAAYAAIYGRPLYFNMVAGAREDDMRRIGDPHDHDRRYERMRSYGRILRALLAGQTVDVDDGFYTYRRFRLEPRPRALSACKLFVAGSSPASIDVACDIADVVVTHPVPFGQWRTDFLEPLHARGYTGQLGIRIGVLCRPDAQDAWRLAEERFPESWIGRQETLLKTASTNVWSRELARRAVEMPAAVTTGEPAANHRDPYWLGAFRSGRASAPFLVGDDVSVGERLAEYAAAGVGHILLHGGLTEDLPHSARAIGRAVVGSDHPTPE